MRYPVNPIVCPEKSKLPLKSKIKPLHEFCKMRSIPFSENEDRFYKIVKQKVMHHQFTKAVEAYDKVMRQKEPQKCLLVPNTPSSSSELSCHLPEIIVSPTNDEQNLIQRMQKMVDEPLNLSLVLGTKKNLRVSRNKRIETIAKTNVNRQSHKD